MDGALRAGRQLIRSDADLDAALPSLSNWGRWGDDDRLGTLNLLTDARRLAAAGLVRTGRAVPLGRELSLDDPGLRDATHEVLRDEDSSRDRVGMLWHGFVLTHLDALNHVFTPQGGYGGRPLDDLGVDAQGGALAGRGVLLDVAPLPLGTAIGVEDLVACERRQGVRVQEGDLLLVRTGAGRANTRERRTGLHPECLPWLKERGVALLGGDGDNDVAPPPDGFVRWASAVHAVAIPYLGLPLVDGAELDELAEACSAEGRWAFLLVVAPWRLRGTTSSPVTPVALL